MTRAFLSFIPFISVAFFSLAPLVAFITALISTLTVYLLANFRLYKNIFIPSALLALFFISGFASFGLDSNLDPNDFLRDAISIATLLLLFLSVPLLVINSSLGRMRNYLLSLIRIACPIALILALGNRIYSISVGYETINIPVWVSSIPVSILFCNLITKRRFFKMHIIDLLTFALIAYCITSSFSRIFLSSLCTYSIVGLALRYQNSSLVKSKVIQLSIIFVVTILYFLIFNAPLNLERSDAQGLQLLIAKMMSFSTELFKVNFANISDIYLNWRAFELSQAIDTFSKLSISQQFFGYGFGSRIPLGQVFVLAESTYSSVPVIHNGFALILYKQGYIGLLSYLGFLFCLWVPSVKLSSHHLLARRFSLAMLRVSILILVLITLAASFPYNIGNTYGLLIVSLFYYGAYYSPVLNCSE